MKRKEPTKTFMMISNWKKSFRLHGLYRNISALKGLIADNADVELCCLIPQ